MRVLHAVRSDGFAGVERHVARLASAQSSHGHRVAVIGGAPEAMSRTIADQSVHHRPATTVLDVIGALRTLAPAADVLHVHMTAAELAASVSRLLARRLPPVVATRHFARARGMGAGGPLVAALARSAVRRQIAVSRYVASAVDGSCTVVHPGVDTRPDARPAEAREPVVLMVQRLQPEKATATGLAVFAASGLANRGWRLQIAGAGSERDQLAALAVDLGIEASTDFLGLRDDVPTLMQRSALLLAPCPVEGLGLTVLEAIASGLPVVASAAGGHLELLDGLDPRALFPVGVVDLGARQLRQLADDADARDTYARREQELQRTSFTLAAQVAATDTIYSELLR